MFDRWTQTLEAQTGDYAVCQHAVADIGALLKEGQFESRRCVLCEFKQGIADFDASAKEMAANFRVTDAREDLMDRRRKLMERKRFLCPLGEHVGGYAPRDVGRGPVGITGGEGGVFEAVFEPVNLKGDSSAVTEKDHWRFVAEVDHEWNSSVCRTLRFGRASNC